ncbi:MAG: hypothetical protein IKO02_04365, partial [Lentisphaeria bacterium]|nr:hypothetical protein [Lentisphaeria bacterium]
MDIFVILLLMFYWKEQELFELIPVEQSGAFHRFRTGRLLLLLLAGALAAAEAAAKAALRG